MRVIGRLYISVVPSDALKDALRCKGALAALWHRRATVHCDILLLGLGLVVDVAHLLEQISNLQRSACHLAGGTDVRERVRV